MIRNPCCRRFYPLLVLECVRTQVVMASLSDVKRQTPSSTERRSLRYRSGAKLGTEISAAVSEHGQAAFTFAENRSNAAQNEKHLIKVEFRQEIGKINN